MKIILLSGPDKNEFYNEKIKSCMKEFLVDVKVISAISSDPANHEKNDRNFYGNETSKGLINQLKDINQNIETVNLIDDRSSNEEIINCLNSSDALFFMGGNPHKQKEFIIKYLEIIKKKVLIGVSAGSMNLAVNSYYSKDDAFPTSHFYKGLGFIDITIDPHFDINNNEQVNDALKFSNEHEIIGLPNESAIFINNKDVKFIGKYYLFKNGIMKKLMTQSE